MVNQEYYKLKEEFLQEWPLSRIEKLTLEEYTNLDKTSFCYWLEAKTNLLGSIWGGSAYKFGIYKRRNTVTVITGNSRRTERGYAWFTKYGETIDEAFNNTKSILISIIKFAQTNDLDKIENIDFGPACKWKIAFLYSDYNVVNIFKWEPLYAAAEYLGFRGEIKSYPILNKYIISKKEINQDYFEFTHFLWRIAENPSPEEEINDDEKESNFDLSFLNQIFYGPPGTGKTFKINSFLNKQKNKEVIKTDDFILVNKYRNFWHLAPGEGGYLWNDLKSGSRLGYEWCSNEIGDLKMLKRDQTNNFNIKSYFSYVKKGDYFCIISGRKFYAIAEALYDYNYSKAITDDFDFQTIEVKWIKIFDSPELLSTSYTPTFARLNGGKRWNSLIEGLKANKIYFEDPTQEDQLNTTFSSEKNNIFTTFHQSFCYEDFIEGIKPVLDESNELRYNIEDGIFKIACDKAANLAGFEDLNDALKSSKELVNAKFEVSEPFFLFIDEINRGNISQIFGELITLIEEDKRLGKDNETRITLPYSKSEIEFCIPPNLYIIGTMNTADRSIEALDTALRRRFSFTEIMPEPKLLEGKFVSGISLDKLLELINKRIEILLDRDHTIGHSYFIKLKEDDVEGLKHIFKNCIIPLLQEYFYSDYEKIGMIIGTGFFDETQEYNNDIFALFPTQNYPEKGKLLRLKTIDEDFDIVDAIKKLLNTKEEKKTDA